MINVSGYLHFLIHSTTYVKHFISKFKYIRMVIILNNTYIAGYAIHTSAV
jgi:hypothetical protein